MFSKVSDILTVYIDYCPVPTAVSSKDNEEDEMGAIFRVTFQFRYLKFATSRVTGKRHNDARRRLADIAGVWD